MPLMQRSADATRHGRRTHSRGHAAVAHAGAVHPRRREAADCVCQRHPQRPRMEPIMQVAARVEAAVKLRRLQGRHRQRTRTVRRRATIAQLPIPEAVRMGQRHPSRGLLTAVVGGRCRPATRRMVVAVGHGRSDDRPRLAVRGSGSGVAVHATVWVCAG